MEVLRLDKELRGREHLVPACLAELPQGTARQGSHAKYLAAWAGPSDDPRGPLTRTSTIGPGPDYGADGGALDGAVLWLVEHRGRDEPPADWDAVVKSKILHEHKASSLDFDWGSAPAGRGRAGQVSSPWWPRPRWKWKEGSTTSCTAAQDGIRVFVDDKSVLDKLARMRRAVKLSYGASASVSGKHLLRVEYFKLGRMRAPYWNVAVLAPKGLDAALRPRDSEARTRPAWPVASSRRRVRTVQRCTGTAGGQRQGISGAVRCPSATARGPCRSKSGSAGEQPGHLAPLRVPPS